MHVSYQTYYAVNSRADYNLQSTELKLMFRFVHKTVLCAHFNQKTLGLFLTALQIHLLFPLFLYLSQQLLQIRNVRLSAYQPAIALFHQRGTGSRNGSIEGYLNCAVIWRSGLPFHQT